VACTRATCSFFHEGLGASARPLGYNRAALQAALDAPTGGAEGFRMRDFVVYTVLTGSFSELNDPFPAGSGDFERICFTDDLSIDPNGWRLEKMAGRYLDATRESRRPKLLPHVYLPDFEWSLYIDATVSLKMKPPEILEQHLAGSKNVWCFRHPWRDCVYDEAEEVIRLGFDDERRVREQMDHYRELGYPRHAGLCAGGMILRRHNDPKVAHLDELWFEQCLRFSKRDQLSFNFVARQSACEYGTFEGELTDNEFMTWPGYPQQRRIPADFDAGTYRWLNPEVQASGMSPNKHYLTSGADRHLAYRTWRSELDRLANKYKTDKGSLYYNAHAYGAVYERYFAPIRTQPLKLLELGLLRNDVQARSPGGPYDDAPSLFLWREYFPNAQIVGFDIADFSGVPLPHDCEIIRGDAGNPKDLRGLLDHYPEGFDIIIDDASHASHQQQAALAVLFPALKSGGYYIVEDLNYQPPSLEQADALKTKELLRALQCGQVLQSPFMSSERLDNIARSVDWIEFHDSFARGFGTIVTDDLAIIRKR
jgi:hypothetical protein